MVKEDIKKTFTTFKIKNMELTTWQKFRFLRLQQKVKEFKRHGKGAKLSFGEARELKYYLYLRATGIRKVYLFCIRKISFAFLFCVKQVYTLYLFFFLLLKFP